MANIALGVVCLICLAVVGVAVFRELAARIRSRATIGAEIDRDMQALMGSGHDDHTFRLPELGLTMADGGERFDKIRRKKSR
jgi:hypothetical protein